ncbi:MAG: ferric reductase-like transmembrane domain-containing protein [Solirubrobacterales bacterium]|nr:ferric reductase-like transmembrane domain-containing protein [Solirubrobacterales bacterium]
MTAIEQTLLTHGWWLASRASGILALVLVTVSVAIGLTMSGKLARRPGLPRLLTALHEQTALAGLIAIAVHGITLLGDPWLNPGVSGLLMPFTMDYRPLWTGLGVVAGLLALVLGLSFYVRKSIGTKLWRKAHRATILVYFLAIGHTLGAGTDASAGWMKWWLIVTTPPIVMLFLYRVGGARFRQKSSRPTRAPRGRAVRPADPRVPRIPTVHGSESR